MRLTATEIDLIRATYAAVAARVDEASTEFYRDLFAASNEIGRMFRGDMSDQGMRFMTALGLIVKSLDNPAILEDQLSALSLGHAAMGVRPGHYAVMNDVLLETLEKFAGDAWTLEAKAAWRKSLNSIADRMLEAA
ncbi:MAG: globin domain-containing protein [Pseudomonadota bacterium]